MAHWSSGQDASLSRWKLGFDSRMGHQKRRDTPCRCVSSFLPIPFTESAWRLRHSANARVRIRARRSGCSHTRRRACEYSPQAKFPDTSNEVLFSFSGDPSAHLPAKRSVGERLGAPVYRENIYGRSKPLPYGQHGGDIRIPSVSLTFPYANAIIKSQIFFFARIV